MRLTRRAALLGLGCAASFGGASLALAAAGSERRFVVVLLRGGMDGMGAVAPYGDTDFATLRAALPPPPPGAAGGLLDLGGFYGLHPALAGLHGLYGQGEVLILHAVASDDRSRSHFHAQDTLELGNSQGTIASGWLNRAAGLLPGQAMAEPALAVGSNTPLLLRGPAPVGHWQPAATQVPPTDFYAQLAALHARDSVTGPAIGRALQERGFNAAALDGMTAPPNRNAFPALCAAAGRLLAAPDGPRLAALEAEGWDTHAHQPLALSTALKTLDDGLVALKAALSGAWAQTTVLVMTEFGRTARPNGSGGTDHGTASAAFLLGGQVAGGKVRGAWPGLADSALFEYRDLAPTTDLRGVAKGLLAAQFGMGAAALAQVFPGSAAVSPLGGLLRA
jgi:uncharacterized protein (DUF1501 family)